jgi:predicted deacylase
MMPAGIRPLSETVLSLQMPFLATLDIRRTVFRGGDGPKVAVLSGIHGDELEGLYLCHRLAAWLDSLLASDPSALRGTVELYPALNSMGLDTLTRGLPVFDTDLNRNFPGRADGGVPSRLAAAVTEAVDGAALVVDVHASNVFLREIPQVRIAREFGDALVPLARRMNVDIIWLHGAVTVLESTVAHSLNARGVRCLVVEMGVGMRITPTFCEQLLVGILNLWRDLGLFPADYPLPSPDRAPMIADDKNVHYLNAEVSGMFVPCAAHWTAVRAGQTLGSIVSPHHGRVLSEVRSPVDGVLFTLRDYPLVYEGSLMARVMERPVSEE